MSTGWPLVRDENGASFKNSSIIRSHHDFSRLGFNQYVSQLRLALTMSDLDLDQDLTSPKSTPSNDYDVTNI